MVLEAIRVVAALVLLLFLPGFVLVQALFPRRNELDENDDLLYRLVLSVSLSIVISIIIGFILGSLGINPDTDRGYFQTPYIIGSLGIFTSLLFLLGLYRGAYPMILKRVRPEAELPIRENVRHEYYEVMDDWRELKEKLSRLELRISDESGATRRRLVARRETLLRKFKNIDNELKKLARKTKEEKSEAKKLHDMINDWKRLKEELHQCEDRLELCTGELYERNKKTADELREKIDNIEKDISFLREDSDQDR
jgi:ubiquitin